MEINIYIFLGLVSAFLLPSPVISQTCDSEECELPKCRCPGSGIPENTSPRDIPYMVLLTFEDSISHANFDSYRRVFAHRVNPNGSPIGGTVFVTNNGTNYSLVKKLYDAGLEIGVGSVTHHPSMDYWAQISKDQLKAEIREQRKNIVQVAGVPEDDVIGWRSPYLQPSGDIQFDILMKEDFLYDSSLVYNPGFVPEDTAWPSTLDSGWATDCFQVPCPEDTYSKLWEVPVPALVDTTTQAGDPCVYLDWCQGPLGNRQTIFNVFRDNFNYFYKGSREPMMLSMTSSWGHDSRQVQALVDFLTWLQTLDDVYIVTIQQAIAWMQEPTVLADLHQFPPWIVDDASVLAAATLPPTTPNPTTQRPTTPRPTTPKPRTRRPTTPKPTTPKPRTRRPTTPKPTTPKPRTRRPTTPRPTTPRPTTPKPTTRKPTTPRPTTRKPTTPRPTTPKPRTRRPITPKPTTRKPRTRRPRPTPKPTTPKPTTPKPTTRKPRTAKPTTQKPTTPKPTTQIPTTQLPTTVKPTTVQPTTPKPSIPSLPSTKNPGGHSQLDPAIVPVATSTINPRQGGVLQGFDPEEYVEAEERSESYLLWLYIACAVFVAVIIVVIVVAACRHDKYANWRIQVLKKSKEYYDPDITNLTNYNPAHNYIPDSNMMSAYDPDTQTPSPSPPLDHKSDKPIIRTNIGAYDENSKDYKPWVFYPKFFLQRQSGSSKA